MPTLSPSKKLGLKHRCLHCNALFYDLKNPNPICPACNKPHNPEEAVKLKPFRSQEKIPAKTEENIANENNQDDTVLETDDNEDINDNPIDENIPANNDKEEE